MRMEWLVEAEVEVPLSTYLFDATCKSALDGASRRCVPPGTRLSCRHPLRPVGAVFCHCGNLKSLIREPPDTQLISGTLTTWASILFVWIPQWSM